MEHDTALGTATDKIAMANDDNVDGNVTPVVQTHTDDLKHSTSPLKEFVLSCLLIQHIAFATAS